MNLVWMLFRYLICSYQMPLARILSLELLPEGFWIEKLTSFFAGLARIPIVRKITGGKKLERHMPKIDKTCDYFDVAGNLFDVDCVGR